MYLSLVDGYQHFAIISYRGLHIRNTDIAGSAETFGTVRLNKHRLEDANFHLLMSRSSRRPSSG
jgi:hypothetical protein